MNPVLLGSISGVFVFLGASIAYCLQSGTVEIADTNTASLVGHPFEELTVDAAIVLRDAGAGAKIWYPPNTIIDIKDRSQRVLVLKVTNNSTSDQKFYLSDDPKFTAPAALKISIVLKPGETKYVGIPSNEVSHLTSGSTLTFKSNLAKEEIEGQLTFVHR